MNHLQQLPCPELQPYVCRFIEIGSPAGWHNPQSFRILADGNPGLVFQENPHSFSGSAGELFPQLFIHGLTTCHTAKTAISPFRNLVVCFQPHALKNIFGFDARELTDTYADLSVYIRNDLLEKLSETDSFFIRTKLLSEFLLNRIAENKNKPTHIQFITETLRKDYSVLCLKNLCSDLKISERSLERIMQSYAGVSPKQFSRISRFQAALTHLNNTPVLRLSEVAYSFGYSDQSHFVRDFREFSGFSPKQFLKHRYPLISFGPDFFE
jgi:AraC-like DNA-binding protein